MDTHTRLRQLLNERGWSEYKLAKECGLGQATIGNIYRRNTVPTLPTLEMICKGLGITLAQFFAEDNLVELTPELRNLFDAWVALSPAQRDAVLNLMQTMNEP